MNLLEVNYAYVIICVVHCHIFQQNQGKNTISIGHWSSFPIRVTPGPQVSEFHKERCLYCGNILLVRISFLKGGKINPLVGFLKQGLT